MWAAAFLYALFHLYLVGVLILLYRLYSFKKLESTWCKMNPYQRRQDQVTTLILCLRRLRVPKDIQKLVARQVGFDWTSGWMDIHGRNWIMHNNWYWYCDPNVMSNFVKYLYGRNSLSVPRSPPCSACRGPAWLPASENFNQWCKLHLK